LLAGGIDPHPAAEELDLELDRRQHSHIFTLRARDGKQYDANHPVVLFRRPESPAGGRVATKTPEALDFVHRELNDALQKAAAAPGRTGEAARDVLERLTSHVLMEQEYATPPLAEIARIANGEITPDMARYIEKTDAFKAELPHMLEDHKLIVEALRTLMQAAAAEKQSGAAQFAQKMIQHAQLEEEVLYPAAILVGEYLRLKMAGDS
jgi:hemerythrin HHE cation binding domain-containing protein